MNENKLGRRFATCWSKPRNKIAKRLSNILGAIAYVVGTLIGYHFAWYRAVDKIATRTLDMLENEGYIKTRRVGNEVELLKIDE